MSGVVGGFGDGSGSRGVSDSDTDGGIHWLRSRTRISHSIAVRPLARPMMIHNDSTRPSCSQVRVVPYTPTQIACRMII
jgi:hypothetical protein